MLIICVSALNSSAQTLFKRKFEPKQALLFDLTLKRQTPGGDLKDRFGANSSFGLDISYKTQSNWIIGCGGHFMFGKNVEEKGVLDSMKGSSGEILDQNGQFAVVGMDERALYFGLSIGKLIPLNKLNANSGLVITLGGGYLQHRIRLFSSNTVPQLADDYKKGYDRLTFGPAASQFIGYRFLDPKKRVNFTAGLEVIEGFTQNRRSLNFDTGVADKSKRLDILTGLKISLTIPIYLKKSTEEEFFE